MTVIEGLFVEIEKELRQMNEALKKFNDDEPERKTK